MCSVVELQAREERLFVVAVTAYGMATLILPAKMGEATFVVYLNRAGGTGASQAIAFDSTPSSRVDARWCSTARS